MIIKIRSRKQLISVISNMNRGKISSVTFTKKDGSTRKIVGKFLSENPNPLGYYLVKDMKTNFRFVDVRTIQSLKINGVKYSI